MRESFSQAIKKKVSLAGGKSKKKAVATVFFRMSHKNEKTGKVLTVAEQTDQMRLLHDTIEGCIKKSRNAKSPEKKGRESKTFLKHFDYFSVLVNAGVPDLLGNEVKLVDNSAMKAMAGSKEGKGFAGENYEIEIQLGDPLESFNRMSMSMPQGSERRRTTVSFSRQSTRIMDVS